MQLNMREAASLLEVPEKNVLRWIRKDGLPAFKINEQYRFNRSEILEWAQARGIPVSDRMAPDPAGAVSLADALKNGDVHLDVGGTDMESVLNAAVEAMPLPEDVDKAFLLRVLVARESLGSTAIGNGVAIPHVRNPIVLNIRQPMVSLCFLKQAIEFGALDGKPVHTLFVIISPTINAHLNLLSRLAYALKQPAFSNAVACKASREEIIACAAQVDAALPARKTETGGGH
ncbi:MAG: PTS sugar transporter subunit IIA [Kiritimatiellia bacterium]